MRLTLRIKLALGLAAILTAILGSSLLVLTLSARQRIAEYYGNYAIHIGDVAEAGLENAMISRDPAEMMSVLNAIDHREGIEAVIVFDKRGEIRYSAVPGDVGRVLAMDDPTCQACHDRPLTDRPQTVILPSPDGGRMLRVAKPIFNQPRCQGCHEERVPGMLVTDFSLAEADQQVADTMRDLLLWSLVTVAGVLGAAIGFVHLMVARPLGRILRVTQSIAAGDLTRRVALAGRDEIAELAASFDSMVQRVADRTRELEALNGVAATVSESLDLDVVMQRAMAKVCEVTGGDWCAIHLLDNPSDELLLAAHHRLPAPAVEQAARLKRGQSFCGWVAEKGEPMVVEDPASDPRSVVRAEGVQSLALTPLRAGGRVVGTLCTGSSRRGQFTPGDLALLQAIGHQVGVAIENARLYAEKQRLSITDPLTGLRNRRALEERLEEEMRRARRYQHPLTLIMADIDHFKRFNDAHGHPNGDIVLRQIAALLQSQARETDLVARYGGEEFVILLPETSKAAGLEVAERIRSAVRAKEFTHAEGQPDGRLTISLGVASYPEDLGESYDLICKADEALYAAKGAGRDRVRGAKVSR